MFSQMAQDYYLYTRHFVNLKRRGVYADVATNDPIGISNTFFMEQCLGWKGLCIEANPKYLAQIHRRRNCALVPTCVGDEDGREVNFGLASGLSGVMATNKNAKEWREKRERITTMRMTCSTMGIELDTYAVRKVDYLSLDVEGHELEVLKGIDWSKVVVNVMTIEVGDNSEKIEAFLKKKGYVRHIPLLNERSRRTGLLHEDAVFLHRDVVFGEPN